MRSLDEKAVVDPVASALDRLQTHLTWIAEHRASYEDLRHSDPGQAEDELRYLKRSTEEAILQLRSVCELLLAGKAIDANKPRARNLDHPGWLQLVQAIRERGGSGSSRTAGKSETDKE